MRVQRVETQRLVTLQLTERELVALAAALSGAEVDDGVTALATRKGVSDLCDDDFTELYGAVCEALRSAEDTAATLALVKAGAP